MVEGETQSSLPILAQRRPSEMGGKEERPKNPRVCLLSPTWMQKAENVVQTKSLIFESSDKFSGGKK